MVHIAKILTIKGEVQGVFYRGWTVKTALTLGLVGWVRNRSNGDVEMLVQGTQADVERLVQLAWQGPPAAQVEDIAQEPADISDLRTFDQRPTA